MPSSPTVIALNLSAIVGAVFHLFMLFVVIYSGLTMFALIRYGRTRIFTLGASIVYMVIVGSLYLHVAWNLVKL